MIVDILAVSIGGALLVLVIAAALSPLETLSWWAGWSEDDFDDSASETVANETTPPASADERPVVIYLAGVATLSGDHLLRRERLFLEKLQKLTPSACFVTDVFPYSPDGTPLIAGVRIFTRLWRSLQLSSLRGRNRVLKLVINIRNIYQVMVAADHRYGPIFANGAAQSIKNALLKAGCARNAKAPIILIGYSGGAQVALSVAPFLQATLKRPIDVISIGGVMASDPGIGSVRRLTHFRGEKDFIEKIGAIMFAERWRIFANSHWNTAYRAGRIEINQLKGVSHAGPRGYFGLPKRNGQSNSDRVASAVAKLVHR